ncbi:MAG: tetratricopeptide repeat protein [Planctomycetota bacterium]|jgi:tetratricopeptide (TPR) repeat protein
MLCSKIGSDCPHPVGTDDNLIFVMMPFTGFTNVYDAIVQAVTNVYDAIVQAVQAIDTKQYRLERADTRFTTLSIWCDRICKNIRRAKYLIVDTTGKNANVFYELGFSHAMENTKAIIITQNVKDAPFDIADINHVEYSKDDLPDLRAKIKAAITDLDAQEPDESYANKTADEVIIELKAQLRTEEQRSADFKKELVETEKREKQLKGHIREIEAIQKDPVEEAKKRMVALEGTIGELKAKLKLTEEDKRETIDQLSKTLEEKQQKLAALEKELEGFKATEDAKPLADSLLDETKNRYETTRWILSAHIEYQKGDKQRAIELFSKAIELDPNYSNAYVDRGVVYGDLKEYERAIQDYAKGLELDPKHVLAQNNVSELKIIVGEYKEALSGAESALSLATTTADKAIGLYLKCIAAKLLEMDTSEAETAFAEVLQERFATTWRFDVIEGWLEEADIDEETKSFIVEKTQMLKKHTR